MGRLRVCTLLALIPSVSACDPAEQTQAGELGAGEFTYHCIEPSDAQCDEGEEVAPAAFKHIATGATLAVSYENEDRQLIAADVYFYNRSARLEVTEREAGSANGNAQVRFLSPGYTALLAYTVDGKVDDILHTVVVDPAGIAISRRDEGGGSFSGSFGDVSIDVTIGLGVTLRAAPTDDAGDILAGALDCEWQSSDDSVVEIVGDPTDNVVDLDLKAPGTSTITVKLGAIEASTDIVVGAP